ncbi:hypothetical protein E2C01_018629 [Portunus trituberculatus]|uniref:Uncharacterized protein n=1 Tax=Portunus trituberculatus TaxID=210409 RepID=A0A5B7DV09_PORTR|nr:hypothetical protein [Portunus trituberculatus]
MICDHGLPDQPNTPPANHRPQQVSSKTATNPMNARRTLPHSRLPVFKFKPGQVVDLNQGLFEPRESEGVEDCGWRNNPVYPHAPEQLRLRLVFLQDYENTSVVKTTRDAATRYKRVHYTVSHVLSLPNQRYVYIVPRYSPLSYVAFGKRPLKAGVFHYAMAGHYITPGTRTLEGAGRNYSVWRGESSVTLFSSFAGLLATGV